MYYSQKVTIHVIHVLMFPINKDSDIKLGIYTDRSQCFMTSSCAFVGDK